LQSTDCQTFTEKTAVLRAQNGGFDAVFIDFFPAKVAVLDGESGSFDERKWQFRALKLLLLVGQGVSFCQETRRKGASPPSLPLFPASRMLGNSELSF
jgi:hypothetical protein